MKHKVHKPRPHKGGLTVQNNTNAYCAKSSESEFGKIVDDFENVEWSRYNAISAVVHGINRFS